VDAAKTFPPQLTSTEKKRMRANGIQVRPPVATLTPQLLERRLAYATKVSKQKIK
jgi:hypothetical protein